LWVRTALLNSAVAGVYFAVARVSLMLAFEGTSASPVWPPAGIALSAMLLMGYRAWPGVLVGAVVANVTVLQLNTSAGLPAVAVASLGVAIGNTCAAVVGRWLITRVTALPGNPLDGVRSAFTFMVVCGLASLVSALVGTLMLTATGIVRPELMAQIVSILWLGDVMGVLIVTPAFLAWTHRPVRDWLEERRVGALSALVALALLSWALFGDWLPARLTAHLPYLIVPFLFWTVFRYGPRVTTLALIVVTAIAVVGTSQGNGCFVEDDLSQSLVHLQLFLGTITTTALGLAAAVSERAAAEAKLTRHREHLERVVAARTEELQRSNRELEQFAYAASHDMQEPLRKIIAFGDRLEKMDGEKLSERGQDFLQRIVKSCARMRALIDDLLQFSRISMGASPFSRVDLQHTLKSVLTDLELLVHDTGGEVETGRLPALEADPFQMRQLLRNLVSNGLKFRRTDIPPVVKVYGKLYRQEGGGMLRGWRADTPEVCEFVVEDNGRGFSPKHAERIFDVFKTLGDKHGEKGTGIGLALCRRIVSRHGGTITVESEIDEGSRFTVTLPARQPSLE